MGFSACADKTWKVFASALVAYLGLRLIVLVAKRERVFVCLTIVSTHGLFLLVGYLVWGRPFLYGTEQRTAAHTWEAHTWEHGSGE